MSETEQYIIWVEWPVFERENHVFYWWDFN